MLVTTPHWATNSVTGEVELTVSWRRAVSVPSRRAARAIRWTVGGRWPSEVNICCRVRTSRTGRPTTRAARAAIRVCCHWEPLLPNAPPVNGQRTRTLPGGMPKAVARVFRTPTTCWVESSTVRWSPFQLATVAAGSMGLLVSMGTV